MFPRKLVATVGVGALALGFLAGMFGKFGLGPGSGGAVGISSTRVDTGAAPIPSTEAPAKKATSDIGGLEGELNQIVLLKLGGDGMQVAEWDGQKAEFRTATLADVIKLAKSRPGTSDGLRVKIQRDPTSRAKTESDLQRELRAAGIPDDAVEWDGGARP